MEDGVTAKAPSLTSSGYPSLLALRRLRHRSEMESTATGAVIRRGDFCPAAAAALRRDPRAAGWAGSGRVSVRKPGGFADEGHLRYYALPARCGGREEEKRVVKMRVKLVKGLAALHAASGGLGVGLAPREAGERKMTLTEAADVLLAQLELLRAEEKEMKRKKKEEKKIAMRAAAEQMKSCDDSEESEDEQEEIKTDYKKEEKGAAANHMNGCKDSRDKEMKRRKKAEKAAMRAAARKMKDCGKLEDTSSSSESSDSDSEEEEVIGMISPRAIPANVEAVTGEGQMEAPKDELNLPTTVSRIEERPKVGGALKCDSGCSRSVVNAVGSNTNTGTCCSSSSKSSSGPVVLAAEAAPPMERIEVCVGGKCKRSGAMELMQEFERRVGIEGAVVGCKCMGKCKEGPNVRVRNVYGQGDDSEKIVRNPLCIGVGLDDVGTIVANFFAEKDVGLLAT